jgi:hypothetical protein
MSKYVQLRDSKTGEPIFPVTGNTDITPITDEEINIICDFDDNPEESTIPIATDTVLGCIKIGDGFSVDASGKIDSKGIQKELLWENASPASEMGSFDSLQIIKDGESINLLNYDEFEIDYRPYHTYGETKTAKIKSEIASKVVLDAVMNNHGMINTTGTSTWVALRTIKIENEEGFLVSEGVRQIQSQTNAIDSRLNILIRIYGIKGVQ